MSHQSEWPSLKSLQTINAGEGMDKREIHTVGGNVRWYNPVEDSMEVLLKTKNITTHDSAFSLLGIYPAKNIIWKYTCTPMFIAALFTTAMEAT